MNIKNIKSLIESVREDERDSVQTLHLTSNENQMSKLAQSFLNSPLSYRYLFGSEPVDVVETATGLMLKGMPGVVNFDNLAQKIARKMFHASVSTFRPTSGLHATLCTLTTATEPGDVIYSIDPDDGGHFATRHLVQRIGRASRFIPWDMKNLTINFDKSKKR